MYPANINYRMPAEWEPHERTFISWPVKKSMCYPDHYQAVRDGYRQFAEAIAEFEPVTIIVNPGEEEALSQELSGVADLLPIRHDDSWVRDNGPTFILNENSLAGINWNFNAWGEKYTPYDQDDRLAATLLDHMGVRCFDAPLVLEGGSIHVDGEGTLLTTEQCLLNRNRNPQSSREDIEKLLQKYLNIHQIIWLKKGLDGDETDGHVDNLACFAAPGKILMQVCADPLDENAAITEENLKILSRSRDAAGREIEVIPVKQPPRRENGDGRLTLSYLNFYLVNGGVILPIFGGDAAATDQEAQEVLQHVFPDRRIRTIDGMAIIQEGGNVHCSTQQMPLGQRRQSI
ncbi:MAG: agmatine deiminase family protein [Sporolactobacillus sp.]